MFGLLFYIFIICLVSCDIALIQNRYVSSLSCRNAFSVSKNHILTFLFCVIPIILIYSLRYGIGTDYSSYKKIFEALHTSSLNEYLKLHKKNWSSYYVEFGYYVLNRYFAFSFESLSFSCSIMMMSFVYFGAIKIDKKINIAYAIFIYFCTSFIYSMNGVRFSIAVTIIFFGFQFIITKQIWKWFVCVFLAALFHKTSYICLSMILLLEFKNKKLNKIRNFIYYIFIVFFPIIANLLFDMLSSISVFSRYFSVAKYALGGFSFKPMFLFHIVPVIVPLIIVKRQFIFTDITAKVLFRIFLLEIPLRMVGSFNTWLTRLTRFSQIAQIVFIPYILSNIRNKKTKYFLTVYYITWYIFYFCYGAIINDAGDSIPYQSILFR